MEEWRDISGYDGVYQISSFGRIRSLTRKCCDGRTRKGQIMSPYIDQDGYKRITLTTSRKRKHYYVHRLVAEAFIENPIGYEQINHKDENKLNNHTDNLEWCDVKYNINYGKRNEKAGISLGGENHYQHKLTNNIVRYIRENYIANDPIYGQSALGRRFGVAQSVIRNAIIGKTWKHIWKETEK